MAILSTLLNKHKNTLLAMVFLILINITVKYIISNSLAIDSDEITWSIIGRRVLSGEDFHIFFLGQKYMGAIEGYIVGIFQAIFGYNYVTLRINSYIFSTLLLLTIYLIFKKEVANKFAIFTSLLFIFLMSFDTAFNFTKAWGNRPLVALLGLLSLYLSYKIFFNHQKVKGVYNFQSLSLLNGLMLGIGFWANLEMLYFLPVTILIFLLSLIKIKKPNIKIKINLKSAVTISFYSNIFFLLFMLFTKKALFNPYVTIATKLKIESALFNILNYNFEPKDFLSILYILGPIKFLFSKNRNRAISNFELIIFMFFVGAYFPISKISVARASGEAITINESARFFFDAVFTKFIGYSLQKATLTKKVLVLASIFTFPMISLTRSLVKNVKNLIKHRKLNIGFIDVVTFYILIPIFFILSKPAGANPSSRYITSLWPGFIILFSYGFYFLLTNKHWVSKTLGVCVRLIALSLFIYYMLNFPLKIFKMNEVLPKLETNDPKLAAEFLLNNSIKNCYAGYWNAYPIMFESKYKVICSPSKEFGYGENETPFNTAIVDADQNPAFVFTNQERINEFYKKWVGKNVEVLSNHRVGKYFIFKIRRLK